MLKGINKEIENTIRIIRESQAEKEKTKAARKNLEALKEGLKSLKQQDEQALEAKIARMDKIRYKLSKDKHEEENPQNHKEQSKIQTGDKVRLINQETVGEVLDVNGDSIMVAFGNMITTVKEIRLFKVTDTDMLKSAKTSTRSPYGYRLSERKLNFSPDIDVRGKRAEEALDTVQKFIDEAVMVSEHHLRILHGKGNGILKQVIRDYLQTMEIVKSCKDEHVERGGAGITVVELEF